MEESGETSGERSNGGRASSFGAIAREIAAMLGAAFVLVLGVSIGAQFIPGVSRYLYLIVAVVFLGLPYLWIERNGWKFRRFGLVADRIWRGLGWGLGFAALTAAPFAVGYWIWESYAVGSSYEFQWDNYQKWEPELEGKPTGWGEEPGVWIWTEERTVRVGLRAASEGDVPLTVQLAADRPFVPDVVGSKYVEPIRSDEAKSGAEGASTWRVSLREEHGRAEVSIAPSSPGTEGFPTGLEVSVTEGASAHPVRAGPGAEKADGDGFEMGRGYRWMYLWLMTQFLFIALPEEYFYRGYVQTRVGEAIEAYRAEKADGEESPETRSWFGVSEENLVASVAFGIGHLLTPVGGALLLNRAAVAFPSIVFGWLRDRTGTITAAVVYHAACNMLVLLAEPHFF